MSDGEKAMSDEWEPVVVAGVSLWGLLAAKPQTSSQIQMRKKDPKDPKGGYFYRDPTQKEIEEYLQSEAW